ncbi:MAG: tyrosine--tRNA ligase [Betaproteobacteria bacterium]|nr:tyrosine--tRNA ligase [Betaproteobacteria bacterium]
MPKNGAEDLELLLRGAEETLPAGALQQKLAEGKPLRIKAGFDPTAADLHLGHTVLMQKMRHFQELGHTVIFLVGDFTAAIGDPSGRDSARPPLSAAAIEKNAATYAEQVFKILDKTKTEIRRNSEWFGKMNAADIIRLASKHTVARMLERDDFSKRHKEERPIAVHEFLYPLVQGYDSVALRADVELGGTDQKFNLLVGRELQKLERQNPQCIMTLPLLEGTDGVKKMSKSAGNYIGITEPPAEIYGKIMSVSDSLMWRYYKLLSEKTAVETAALEAAARAGENPIAAKKALARELCARFCCGWRTK